MTHQRLSTRMGDASHGRGATAVLSAQLAHDSGHGCDISSHMALVLSMAPNLFFSVYALAMTPSGPCSSQPQPHRALLNARDRRRPG